MRIDYAFGVRRGTEPYGTYDSESGQYRGEHPGGGITDQGHGHRGNDGSLFQHQYSGAGWGVRAVSGEPERADGAVAAGVGCEKDYRLAFIENTQKNHT